MPLLKEQIAKLKFDLGAAIHPLLLQFQKDTGILPHHLEVSAIDVSTFGNPDQYIMGDVHLEFKL